MFKQHQNQFKEIKDQHQKINLYINTTIVDGTYYCYQHLEYEDVKVKKRGGSGCSLGVTSVFPNTIDSRRIYENQNCCSEQFVEEKPLK